MSNSRLLDDTQPIIPLNRYSENLDELFERKPLLKSLAEKNPLPEQYKHFFSKETGALTFSIAQAVGASFLFIRGSQRAGFLYQLGGVASNFEQNLLFGIQAAYGLCYWLINYKDYYGRLSLASLLAVLSTTPSTIATYSFSGNYYIPTINFFGNISMNFYGSAQAINRIVEWWNDNPKLRAFLEEKLREELKDTPYENYLSLQYPKHLNHFALGLGLAIAFLALNQTGYICSTEVYLEDKMKNQAGAIISSIITNLPQIFIAAGPGGFDIANKAVHKAYDIYAYYTNLITERLSKREVKYLLAEYALIGASAFFAVYSSATSKELYDEKCHLQPVLGSFISNAIGVICDQGAMFYNFVIASLAVDTATSYFLHAYSGVKKKIMSDVENQTELEKTDLERNNEKYRVEHMEGFIQKSSVKDLEQIATQHYPNEIQRWQQPRRKSICERLCFFRRADDYVSLDDELISEPKSQNLTI